MLWRILGIVALILVAAAVIVWFVLRPRSHRWGATREEVARAMPGDELVPHPRVGYTQAITIDAPLAAVWSWVVQIGYKALSFHTALRSQDASRGAGPRTPPKSDVGFAHQAWNGSAAHTSCSRGHGIGLPGRSYSVSRHPFLQAHSKITGSLISR